MMEQEHWFITPLGERRYMREWLPAESPESCLLIIHGLADHIGRFCHLAEYLNGHRIFVAGFDLEGNGQSPGKRGHFSTLEKVWEEMSAYIRLLRTRFPGLPVILYGQSMGGNLVLNFGIRYPGEVNGIIASSPWIRLTHPPSTGLKGLMRMLHSLFPALLLPNGVKGYDLSHDPAIADKYHSDPLVHGKISLQTFFLITHAGEYLLKHAGKLNTPLLLMHGTADPVTSFEASKTFFRNLNPYHPHDPIPQLPNSSTPQLINSSTHQLLPWPGLLHELHNEPQKEQIMESIVGWIKREVTGMSYPISF